MTTIHHSPPPGTTFHSFANYEDPDGQCPPSPSEAYNEELSFNSESLLPCEDEAFESIEPDNEHEHEHEHEHEQDFVDEPEPYRSSFTSRPSAMSAAASRRVSAMTNTSFISSLPSEISINSKPAAPADHAESRYTPRRDRPPFRNPSSVRAMQMSSPVPFESPRDRLRGTYKLATPSRSSRSETPVSASGSRRHRESHGSGQSPRPAPPTPQQHLPLVLLHVTIIPMQFPYSPELMAKVMPEWLVENYKLLEEKLQDIVLMRRGLLISHPREEYDVLEERILESLELRTPRLLKCGHFVAPEDPEELSEDEDDEASVTDDATGRGSRMSGGTLTVEEEGEWNHHALQTDHEGVCTDCHRHVKRPGKGVGKGYKKWDLKIYAANGLMRSGAWSAAWSEMERCDVEIVPWIPEDVRKSLEKKVHEQQERQKQKQLYEAEVIRRVEEETTRLKRIEDEAEEMRRVEEAELQKKSEAATLQKKLDEEAAEKKRLEDVLNERIEEAKEAIRLKFEMQALQEADSVAERFRTLEEALKDQSRAATKSPDLDAPPFDDRVRSQSRGRPRSSSSQPPKAEIPLSTLLSNYFLVLARDQRNLIIIILGAGLFFLSTRMNPTVPFSNLPGMLPVERFPDAISSVVVTTTATSIATSIETVTVTQLQHPVGSAQASSAISSAATSLSVLESSTSTKEASSLPTSSLEPHETTIASATEKDHQEPSKALADSQSMYTVDVAVPEEPVSVLEDASLGSDLASPISKSPAVPEQIFKSEADAQETTAATLSVHGKL